MNVEASTVPAARSGAEQEFEREIAALGGLWGKHKYPSSQFRALAAPRVPVIDDES